MFRRTQKVIKRINKYKRGNSDTKKVVVETYWFLIIPVYSRETILF